MAGATLHQSFLPLSKANLRRRSPSLPRRSTVVVAAMSQNQSYWASIDSDIESHLKNAIPIREPVSVFEPMHHLTFSPPKTTAASLCIAACELLGGSRGDALEAASAIHLMHAAAYTHENLPLTDTPTPTPTPKPETPHAFGPNIELLTGDGIIPFALELLAGSMNRTRNNSGSGKILRVIVEITRAVGSQGVVDGQYRESQGLPDPEWAEHICVKKEGGLHACGAACGAILGGGSEEEIEKLRRYGLYVGMVQGILQKNVGDKLKLAEKWRALAVKELEYFDSSKTEQISKIIEAHNILAVSV